MSRRNVVRVAFEVVDGGGLRDLERASNALNNLGRAGAGAAPGVGGAADRANEAARASENLAGSAGRATGGLSNMQKAGVATAAAISAVAIGLGLAAKAAIDFGIDAVAAAERANRAQLQLQATAKLTGQEFNALNALADDLVKRVPELSRAQAAEVVARGARFTAQAGRPEDTSRFIDAIIAAMRANGASISDLAETLKQVGSGGLETALDKILGGKNPSEVFKARFAEVGAKDATSLSDAQQKQAVLNEIFAQAGQLGAIIAPQTIGRNVDILKARFEDLESTIGHVIERNEGLKKTVEALTQLTTKLGEPSLVANIETLGRGISTIAVGAIGAATGFALIGNAVKLAADSVIYISKLMAGMFSTLGTIVSSGITNIIALAIKAVQTVLGPAAALTSVGFVDTDKLIAESNARVVQAAQEQVKTFNIGGSTIQADLDRFGTFLGAAAAAIKVAEAFGRFDTNNPTEAETLKRLAAARGEPTIDVSRDPFESPAAKAATAATQAQTKATKDLADKVDKIDVFGSITVIAGPNTTVDYVPAGGATP